MEASRWCRIEQLFHQAAELPLAGQSDFLDRACGDDEELRREVESLLAVDIPEDGFVQAAVALAAEQLPAEPPEDSDLIGKRVGRYSITGLIGRGGMGAVYRAERQDDFRMQVAIKLLKRGTDTDVALNRFRIERQILARLQHPNIARLLDGGATETGLPFFVMEYVEGTPLLEYAAPLSTRQRLELFRTVCSAVQYAHQKSIVHRDIKPANILVTREGIPKLLDFGIAKLLDRSADGGTLTLTATGVRPMTPGYASPEQVRGEPVTTATDIYSLGAVLYELLTGRRAHPIEANSAAAIEKEICTREPRRPSALAKDLDPDLDNIVLMALRKEPERRYASVEHLSLDLDRFLRDVPVQARKESPPYRARKFLKRNRVASLAAAATAAIVLVSVAGLQRFGQSSGGAGTAVRSIAVLPLEDLSHDPQQEPLVDGMTDALIGDLGKIRSLRVISRDSVMRYKGVHKPAGETARELKASALVEGSVLRTGERVRVTYRLTAGTMNQLLWTQTYDRDFQDVPALQSDAARAIAREIQIQLTPQEEARLSSRPVNRQAYEAYLRGQHQMYKHTREGYEQALKDFQEAIDIDAAYALAWAGLADGYYELSTAVLPAREAMPRARAAAQKALSIDGTLVEAHATLATIQSQYDWDWLAAEGSYKRALELNPSYAQGYLYYGWYLAEQGRMEDAIRETSEAQRLDPLTPWRATNLAWMYYLARRYDEAIAQFHKILEFDSNFLVTHYSLGEAYEQKGMFEQAIAEFLKARALDNDCDQCLAFLGHAYGTSGKKEDARHTLEKLLESSRQRHVDGYWPGLIYAGLGDAAKTFEWFEKAYQDRSEDLLFLKVDPRLDIFHSDPRFKSLVRRLGLPQ